LTRNLLGLRTKLLTETKGNLIINNFLLDYVPYTHQEEMFRRGVLLSSESGVAMGYSLNTIQERGDLIIEPGTQVYEGMIIGNTSKGEEMMVNPTKGKQLSNMRSSGADEAIVLVPAWEITIERGLEIMNADEYLEVTPKSVRLRKQLLTESERSRAGRKS
jgi:GTP-binding protein